jgi:hypothetical protein
MLEAVSGAGSNAEVVVEATYGWYWAVDLLQFGRTSRSALGLPLDSAQARRRDRSTCAPASSRGGAVPTLGRRPRPRRAPPGSDRGAPSRSWLPPLKTARPPRRDRRSPSTLSRPPELRRADRRGTQHRSPVVHRELAPSPACAPRRRPSRRSRQRPSAPRFGARPGAKPSSRRRAAPSTPSSPRTHARPRSRSPIEPLRSARRHRAGRGRAPSP